jgi:hypothetical protein
MKFAVIGAVREQKQRNQQFMNRYLAGLREEEDHRRDQDPANTQGRCFVGA